MSSTRSVRHPAEGCGLPVLSRRAARVLVVDAIDRLLLFRGCDPADAEAGTWWFTVGGGVEEDESTEQAARRELLEETGIRLTAPDGLVGPVWLRETEFDFDGLHIVSDEAFYLVRVPVCEVVAHAWTELEQRSVLGHGWWSAEQLAATPELVYPPELAGLLPDLVAGVVPSEPVRLGA